MYFVLLMVVILTAIGLVAIALGVARAISPRSYNPQKGEAYECGIPTRGKSWMQFKVGYYLFAILFLIFDVEAMFMFPWAVIVREVGVAGLFNILFFMLILVLGLAYAWKKLEACDGIDAYLAHSWIDARFEGGLRTGLRKYSDDPEDPFGTKPSWIVFRDAGTENEPQTFEFAKRIIGISSWEEIVHSVNKTSKRTSDE